MGGHDIGFRVTCPWGRAGKKITLPTPFSFWSEPKTLSTTSLSTSSLSASSISSRLYQPLTEELGRIGNSQIVVPGQSQVFLQDYPLPRPARQNAPWYGNSDLPPPRASNSRIVRCHFSSRSELSPTLDTFLSISICPRLQAANHSSIDCRIYHPRVRYCPLAGRRGGGLAVL